MADSKFQEKVFEMTDRLDVMAEKKADEIAGKINKHMEKAAGIIEAAGEKKEIQKEKMTEMADKLAVHMEDKAEEIAGKIASHVNKVAEHVEAAKNMAPETEDELLVAEAMMRK